MIMVHYEADSHRIHMLLGGRRVLSVYVYRDRKVEACASDEVAAESKLEKTTGPRIRMKVWRQAR